MADVYHTIDAPAEAVFTEKRSKFLAFAYPVASAEEVKPLLAALQKRFFDARHICWAYMLGAARTEFRANDNGEPSGTAGKPILGQINSLGLTDVVIFVVRYFGGIKLGTPGLIAAYREAARLVLDEATISERHVMVRVRARFPYEAVDRVMRLVRAPGVRVLDTDYQCMCSMTLDVEADRADSLCQRLTAIDSLTFERQEQTPIE